MIQHDTNTCKISKTDYVSPDFAGPKAPIVEA